MSHRLPALALNALLALTPALAIGLFAPAAAAQQAQQGQQVGVLDVDRLFSETRQARDLIAEGQRRSNQLSQTLEAGRQQLQQLAEQAQALNPESQQFREIRQQLVLLQAQMQAREQLARQELEDFRRASNLRLLRAIQQATADVAQERNLALVIRKRGLPENIEQRNAQEVDQLTATMMVFYASPTLDVTSEVIVRMDSTYQPAQQTQVPPAPQGGQPANGQPAPGPGLPTPTLPAPNGN